MANETDKPADQPKKEEKQRLCNGCGCILTSQDSGNRCRHCIIADRNWEDSRP